MKIPRNFIEAAINCGLSETDATEYFITRSNKQNIKYIRHRLIHNGVFPDITTATKALNNLWNANVQYNQFYPNSKETTVETLVENSYINRAKVELDRMIGASTYRTKPCPKAPSDRIAVGGDIHGVFANERAFKQFLNDPARKAIIMGDVLDLYSISKYRQTIDYISLKQELADGRAKMEAIANAFPDGVYVTKGNHDNRSIKRIQELCPQLLPVVVHPLDLIIQDLPNVHLIALEVENTRPNVDFGTNHKLDYAGLVGDILVGHFEGFCGADAAKGVEVWLNKWKHILKLKTEPTVILQGHNHQMNMTYTSAGRLLISTGCLAKPQPYQFDQHAKYNPPVVGYIALYQHNGVTDRNKTEYIFIGTE